jgi:hypothetical protein
MRLKEETYSAVPKTGYGRKNNDRTKPCIVGHGREEYVGRSDKLLVLLLGSSCRTRALDMGSG